MISETERAHAARWCAGSGIRGSHSWSRAAVHLALVLSVLCLALSTTRSAHAYPWMIRHDYTGCATCHVDPTGGGVLTEYGSAQGDILLRTHYRADNSGDVNSTAGFLWGAVKPPDWFLPSGSLRTLAYGSKIGSASFATGFVIMQADLRAAIVKGGFRAYASVGFVGTDGSWASVAGPLVSREHWLGWAFGRDDAFLLRAGRINLPFGIRQIEHVFFVREATRTDLNDTQQHGVALSYNSGIVRAELMGIAGNYQVSPDVYRERGYAGFVEVAPLSNAAFGLSSLVTHSKRDLVLNLPDTRQAHGVFARWAPVQPVAVLAEADLVAHSAVSTTGYVTMLQADVEPVQGVHFIATGENWHSGDKNTGTSWGGWLGAGWFFAPHADVRLDFEKQSRAQGATQLGVTSVLAQLHVYL